LVSQFEATCAAQSICQELKKPALNSTEAQFSIDKLLQYITTTHIQVFGVEHHKLTQAAFPPKEKLYFVTVGEAT
jgi:hypothetical protein